MLKTVINCHVWNRGLQNQTEKVPCTVSSNVSKFLSSWCLQGLFYTFTWYDYRAQSSALNFEKKYFHQKQIKMTSIQGLQANKMLFSRKFALKNARMPRMSIYIGQQQVLFITQEQLAKFYSAIRLLNVGGPLQLYLFVNIYLLW